MEVHLKLYKIIKKKIPAPPEGLDFLGKGVQTPSLSFQTVGAV